MGFFVIIARPGNPVSARGEFRVVYYNNTLLLDASGIGRYGAGVISYFFGRARDVHIHILKRFYCIFYSIAAEILQ